MNTGQIADRALVDLAAKAAGIAGEPILSFGGFPGIDVGTLSPWLPLHKDSDNYRLAAYLNMHIEIDGDTLPRGVTVVCDAADRVAPVRIWLSLPEQCSEAEKLDTVRRAVVLAAAELGAAK